MDKIAKILLVKRGIVIIFIFIGIIVWRLVQAQQEVETDKNPIVVSTTNVNFIEKPNSMVLAGTVESLTSSMISSRLSGKVERVLVEDGQAVTKGMPLFVLDAIEHSNAVRIAQNGVQQTETKYQNDLAEYQRYEALYKKGACSLQQMESYRTKMLSSQAEMDSAHAYLVNAQKQMDETVVVSPTNGVIANKNLAIGQIIAGGSQVMSVEKIDSVYVVMNVEQKHMSKLNIGDLVDIKIDIYPDRIFQGRLTVMNPVAGNDNRLFRIKAAVDNSDQALKPGMFVQALLKTGEIKKVLTVPKNAVLSHKGLYYVYTIEHSRAKKVLVGIGDFINDNIEICGGITAETIILTDNLDYVKEGDLLQWEEAS